MTHVTSELRWFCYLFRELGIKLTSPPTLCDNRSAIFMAKNPTITSRSRHIEISYYFVWELVNRGALRIEFVPSTYQFVDGFTKVLALEDFLRHRIRHKLVLVELVIFSASNQSRLLTPDLREDVKDKKRGKSFLNLGKLIPELNDQIRLSENNNGNN